MIRDFRYTCFQILFENDINDLQNVEYDLSANQKLRAEQLLKNTQDNIERIDNSINTYSDNYKNDVREWGTKAIWWGRRK